MVGSELVLKIKLNNLAMLQCYKYYSGIQVTNWRGDQTSILAEKTKAMMVRCSASFSAELSVASPRKLIIFII